MQLKVCAVFILLAFVTQGLNAGPNRAARVSATPSGVADLKPDGTTGALHEDGSYVNSQGQTVYSELDHYCRVSIGPDKQTWVQGVGKIVIVPTTRPYTRTYELSGWDAMIREGTITGCDMCLWQSSADCWLSLSAEAGKDTVDRGAVVAQCSSELRYWEYGMSWAADARECTVSTSTTSNLPTGYSDSEGVAWPDHGSQGVMEDPLHTGALKGNATNICSVFVPLHPNPFIPVLQLNYKEYARLYMNVEPDHGHSKVDVVHGSWTPGGGRPQTNYWKVTMEAWDWDDPANPMMFRRWRFDGEGNQ